MASRSAAKILARQQLDRRFAALRKASDFTRPPRGWIKAIREALGMSTTQLAARLRVSQTRVSQIEKAEAGTAIRLQTLRQVAEALDCTLVYALVPNRPLETMARDRAAHIADLQLARTDHSMRLENQALGPAALAAERERLIRQLLEGEPRRLWEPPMSDPLSDVDEASTPLTPDERADLIPSHITNRDELNAFEARGVADADGWAFSRRRGDRLSADFLRRLHRRMFGQVWRWAGTTSKETGRRIGVDHHLIEPQLWELFDTVRYWIECHTYAPDEIAVRYHHRLTQIHPFPNGNGRLARLAADLLIAELGSERFTWGRASLVQAARTRTAYVEALRMADAHVITPLIEFARS